MNILHYSLGFPPFRRGGMTQYCVNLMEEQVKDGHKVGLLWPGRLHNLNQKSYIEKKQKYAIKDDLFCDSYELINPLPIPLMDGIKYPEMYLIEKDKEEYREFFHSHQFDVLHIHSFMGLPAELVDAAHEVGIKTIFTTHDYFPLCPRCNLFHSGKDCIEDHDCEDCVSCNQNGLSLNKMKLFQSNFYRFIKENTLVKILRERHNRKMYDATEQVVEVRIKDTTKQLAYQKLRKRNLTVLEGLDVIHFNSTNTLCVYQGRGYSGQNAQLISISNGAIENHKKIRSVNGKIRFGYLGPITTHKGYNLFKNSCDALWESGIRNFEAHIFVELDNPAPYMICHKPYKYDELPNVMNQFDILVTPSEWEETFGFTVLEALSYGLPVIVSNKVGAKDIIVEGKNGFIVDCDVQALKKCMLGLIENPQRVNSMNEYIVNDCQVKTMAIHAKEIEELYKLLIMSNQKGD